MIVVGVFLAVFGVGLGRWAKTSVDMLNAKPGSRMALETPILVVPIPAILDAKFTGQEVSFGGIVLAAAGAALAVAGLLGTRLVRRGLGEKETGKS